MTFKILRSHVAILVPSTKCKTIAVNTAPQITKVREDFRNWFGGSSMIPIYGDYESDQEGDIQEITYFVFSFCTTEQLVAYSPSVISLAEWLCKELDQECVAVILNGTMFFVDSVA